MLKKIRDFEFLQIDLKDFKQVENVFSSYNIDTVMHFAASIVVPESINNPIKYYENKY